MSLTGFAEFVLFFAAGGAINLIGLVLLRRQVALLAGGRGGLSAAFYTILRFAVAGLAFWLMVRHGLLAALAGLAGYTVFMLFLTAKARYGDAWRFTP